MQTVPASPLPPTSPGVLVPNAYALSGDNVRVDYSATSTSGEPLLHATQAVLTRTRLLPRLPRMRNSRHISSSR